MNNDLKKELEGISPYLLQMKEIPEPYRVPEGFFAEMRDNVFTKLKDELPQVPVEAEKVTELPRMSFWMRFRHELDWFFESPVSLASTSFAAVLLLFWWKFSPVAADNCSQLACVSEVEIQQYLEQHLDEIDTETLWIAAASENAVPDEPTLSTTGQTNADLRVKDADEGDVQQLLQEMIDNGELSEEDLKDII